ncbi:MAG: transposase [Coriobacteriia bacterium]|nr:transposase [Coriobacteriia bacterium]
MSSSGIYHVMLRGINHQAIFFDDADRIAFLCRLLRFKDSCNFKVYAYSLMESHVHILFQEGPGGISDTMKRLALSYSHYFNSRYDRTGYLFQGRFSSKTIDSETQLLATVRYIHNNPVEVGESICFWTSFGELVKAKALDQTLSWTPRRATNPNPYELTNLSHGDLAVVDVLEALDVMGASVKDADTEHRQQMLSKGVIHEGFTQMPPDNAPEVGFPGSYRISDREALAIILDILGTGSALDIQLLDRATRDIRLAEMKRMRLSVRQISRLTGVNANIVQRAKFANVQS